jgi:hypothetical protein
MSALGQKQTFGPFIAMSALPPKADIEWHSRNVRFVPQADIRDLCHNRPRRIFVEQPDGRSPARLSIGLRHTIGAAANTLSFA